MPNPEQIQQLKNLVASGKTTAALKALRELSSRNSELENDVITLQSSWEKLIKEENLGIISGENARRESTRINHAILQFIGQLKNPTPPTTTNQFPTSQSKGTNSTKPQQEYIPPTKPSQGENTDASSQLSIPWIIGLAMIAAIVTLLVLVPCPSEGQFLAFRVTLAIGAGILTSQLPGMFQLNMAPFIKAGGALAVFAAVYFMNPASLINTDQCNAGPFEFTIQVENQQDLEIPSNYPPLAEANLEIWLDNYWKPADAMNGRVADFKTIPADKRDQKVRARLQARYWSLVLDSIELKGKSQIVYIQPDGSLSKIRGKVMDLKDGSPIANATIEAQGFSTTSNELGNFTLNIDLAQQRDEYRVHVIADKYQSWQGSATPATGDGLRVLLEEIE